MQKATRELSPDQPNQFPVQSAAIGAGVWAVPTASPSAGGVSCPNDQAIQANATAAVASMAIPVLTGPKISLPMPNRVPYAATMPAIQLAHASRPAAIGSGPNPARTAMRR